MRGLALLFAFLIIMVILWDAFETVVLPRRVSRRIRLTRFAFVPAWRTYSALMRRIPLGGRRETYLSYFGPLSIIWLLALWAVGLILGFGLAQWGLGSQISTPDKIATLGTDVYFSGTTFFTLGLGDVTPHTTGARLVTIAEAGIGFGFLALIISYLPVLYQAFSQREVRITLLDAWAGSPPTAVEFLRRLGIFDHVSALDPFLEKWEEWAADLLDSHIAYPNLCYYRSEHDNQSWLAALTTVLDACAIIMAGIDGVRSRTAALTFAMARHAVVDLSQILNRTPREPEVDRLPREDLARLREILTEARLRIVATQAFEERLTELREMYEPYVNALSDFLLMPLPVWIPQPGIRDNWQRSKWKTIAHFH
jgi:Ion channel